MSRASRRFCTEDSERIGDPLAGSGTHAERNLLLSWPRRRWRRSLRQAADMSETVGNAIEAIAMAGRRVNLIDRQGQPSHCHRVFLMPERQAFDVPREALPEFLGAFRRSGSLQRWYAGPVERELILCCTHAKKDKCCAKYGYGTYRAIADTVLEQRLAFDVWESTHLGGCRLAASVILLPRLRKYGRIGPADVQPLLACEGRGRPYLPCYRGDSRLSPMQQCAQVGALMWLDARDREATVTVGDETGQTADGTHVVPVDWSDGDTHGSLQVRCTPCELVRHDTCADYAAGPKVATVWHATGVNDVSTAIPGRPPRLQTPDTE